MNGKLEYQQHFGFIIWLTFSKYFHPKKKKKIFKIYLKLIGCHEQVKINDQAPKNTSRNFQKVTSNFSFSKRYDYHHSATTTMSPVNLKDCMEEVVKYTLESHINETLEFDLGLSKSFCSDLLKLDPNDPNTTTTSGNYLITSSSSSLIYGSCSSLLEFRANCESKHVQEESQFS